MQHVDQLVSSRIAEGLSLRRSMTDVSAGGSCPLKGRSAAASA